jgi:hypothetical protein
VAKSQEEVSIVAKPSDSREEELGSIRAVKTKYWRCTDKKQWNEVGECFAEDAVIDYPNGVFRGRQGIVDSLKQTLGEGPTAHEGRNLGIDMTGGTSARGSWQADVSMTDVRTGKPFTLRVSYDDEYVKLGGGWLMKTSKMRIMPAS